MSRQNSPENKKLRREEREDKAFRIAKKRELQTRMMDIYHNPPDNLQDIEAMVARITEEVNEETGKHD